MIINIAKAIDIKKLMDKILEFYEDNAGNEPNYLIMNSATWSEINFEIEEDYLYFEDIDRSIELNNTKLAICEALKFGDVDLV